MVQVNLKDINGKLAAKGKRTHQNLAALKGVVELRKQTVELERSVRALDRQVKQMRAKKKLAAQCAKPSPKKIG